MKISDLIGPALEWAVAKCEGTKVTMQWGRPHGEFWINDRAMDYYELDYSTDWAQGGPIIEREQIELIPLWLGKNFEGWASSHRLSIKYDDEGEFIYKSDCKQYGPTTLISAMRCYVSSKLGDEVEVPKELQ